MRGTRPPCARLVAALATAALIATSATASPIAPEPDATPGEIIGGIGRCFSTLLWDFGIGAFAFQFGSCSIYIPIQPGE
jgi:hypothetical protein